MIVMQPMSLYCVNTSTTPGASGHTFGRPGERDSKWALGFGPAALFRLV
jgi:hypothetical protein